jgi:hypothetical protein
MVRLGASGVFDCAFQARQRADIDQPVIGAGRNGPSRDYREDESCFRAGTSVPRVIPNIDVSGICRRL